QLAETSQVADIVHFLGRRERHELSKYYSAADVFVTTPWYEPFGITPVEAMACARPVIGSDVGGIRYTVQPGKTGFLVPPRDPVALADRLAALAANPSLAWRMGNAGLRRARSQFTWSQVAQKLARVYEDIAAPVVRAPVVRAATAARASRYGAFAASYRAMPMAIHHKEVQ